MTTNEFLQKTAHSVGSKGLLLRPHVYCTDGFEFSLQAGKFMECEPKENLFSDENYVSVEIGFPSVEESLLLPYLGAGDSPINGIYTKVPVEVVDKVLEKHGGMDVAEIFGAVEREEE